MDEREKLLKKILNQWIELCKKYPTFAEDQVIKEFMHTGHNSKLLCYLMEQILYGALDDDRQSDHKVKLIDVITQRNERLNEKIKDVRSYLSLFKNEGYQRDKKEIEASFTEFNRKLGSKLSMENCDKFKTMKAYVQFLKGAEFHQFQKGKASSAKPIFAKTILVFESMDLAIRYIKEVPGNVILLAGIKPNQRIQREFLEHGFFAYLVKNGENIFALTDIHRGQSFYPSVAGRREVYRDELMPYVELGEFKYVWSQELFGIKIEDLNTDKYFIVPYGRKWDKWNLAELAEAEQILLQYFIYSYLKNLVFDGQLPELESSYTQSQILLTIHGCPINQHYLPIDCKANTLTVELAEPNPEMKEELGLKRRSDLIYFEKEGTLVDTYGHEVEGIEVNACGYACDPDKLRGFSPMCFGTTQQIENYLKRVESFNAEQLMKRKNQEQKKQDEKQLRKFYDYLFSDKFAQQLIDQAMNIALSQKNSEEATLSRQNFWLEDLFYGNNRYKECIYENKHCVFTGKTASFMMRIKVHSLKQLMEIWNLSEDQLPKALTERNGLSIGYLGGKFECFRSRTSGSALFLISKSAMNQWIKKRDLNKEQTLSLIRGGIHFDPQRFKNW